MGADLYIESLYEANRKKYEGLFEKWVKVRDGFDRGSEAAAEAQKEVSLYFDRMHAKGYFRDSYNDSSVLWLYGLSWWEDVSSKLVNKKGMLTPTACDRLLVLLDGKQAAFEVTLKAKLADKEWVGSEKPEEIEKYMVEKAKRLRAFLKLAIKMKEGVRASL